MPLFTPAFRQETLDRLLAALERDSRIAGVLIIGSGAEGFADDYSDIDLSPVVAAPDDTLAVFRDWQERIRSLLPVRHCLALEQRLLMITVLNNWLEVDMGFVNLETLVAKQARWKLAFDRSGQIDAIMCESWGNRNPPELNRSTLDMWFYVHHALAAIRRGQTWRALAELDSIRTAAIEIAGLRLGLETMRFRHVDRMPPDLLAALRDTLPTSTDLAEIHRAVRAASMCFIREVREYDALRGLHEADEAIALVEECLAVWG